MICPVKRQQQQATKNNQQAMSIQKGMLGALQVHGFIRFSRGPRRRISTRVTQLGKITCRRVIVENMPHFHYPLGILKLLKGKFQKNR